MEITQNVKQVWAVNNHKGCAYCETLVADLKGFYIEESKVMED